MARIEITWFWINWGTDYSWKSDVVPQLQEWGLKLRQWRRSVYVIRAEGTFAIQYPKRVSPVLYIGEGRLGARLSSHKKWLRRIEELVGEFPLVVYLCCPRVKNNWYAYQDVEADLLRTFRRKYGAAPMMNKQIEYPYFGHRYKNRKEFLKPLGIGRGRRYYWAIRPMRSNPGFVPYMKAHDVE